MHRRGDTAGRQSRTTGMELDMSERGVHLVAGVASDPASSVEHILALVPQEVAVGRGEKCGTVHGLAFSSPQSESLLATALVPGNQGQEEETNPNKTFELQTNQRSTEFQPWNARHEPGMASRWRYLVFSRARKAGSQVTGGSSGLECSSGTL